MAQPIKISRATAARASASVSTELPNTGIDIDPVEEARKLQFMHRLGMWLIAAVFAFMNVALCVGGGKEHLIITASVSVIAFLVILYFSRLALARSLAALMTWYYSERGAFAAFANRHLLQTLLNRLSVEQ